MNDKNTPGPWAVRVRRSGRIGNETECPVVDCFVQAPDVHGYAYAAEVLGDDEYREETGIERKLADCQLIAAALVMREALRWIRDELGKLPVRGHTEPGIVNIHKAVDIAFAELTKAPK